MDSASDAYLSRPLYQKILIIPGLLFSAFLLLMLTQGQLIALLFIIPVLIAASIPVSIGRSVWPTLAWVMTIYGVMGPLIILLSLISFP